MPTNVTPEYRRAEEAYRAAQSTDEKIERLEEMIALLPKHKGTDHLFADLKKRLSKLHKQQEGGQKSSRGSGLDITREGAAQVILVGPPNSGKSSILKALTNAHPDIGDYPFTTHQMIPGMARYLDIQIQIVDTPPVTSEYMPTHLLSLVRGADAILLVADLSRDSVLEDMEAVLQAFSHRQVRFARDQAARTDDDDRDALPSRVLANKIDAPGAAERLDLLGEMFPNLEMLALSSIDPQQVGKIPEMLFNWLKIVRVYTKIPGRKADRDHPYTVFAGQTVDDISLRVHKDFHENLRFARLWRGDQPALTVSRNEVVHDEDILELHT